MIQTTLDFTASRSRKRDPTTSHAAADRVDEFAANHHGVIVLALKDHGPMTIDEFAACTPLDKWAVARRLPELETLGAVRIVTIDGVEVTRPGISGRRQRVWEAVR